MQHNRGKSGRKGERGVVILLVAILLLFVVGAMAVLSIDVVSFYTARSEAQLAADGAALAAARVLANSGMTSNPTDIALVANVETLARTVAAQVAVQNKVGGRNLIDNGSEIKITILPAATGGSANPQVTVQISRTDLPTFFARIWGQTQFTVKASATAEAYNPSGLNTVVGQAPPVAPVCVKPWVLPNLDPRIPAPTIILDPATGAIQDTTLLGYDLTTRPMLSRLPTVAPSRWHYYAGDQSSFPAPTQSLPTCNVALDNYQTSIAGCVQTPISCNSSVNLDLNPYANRNTNTAHAVNCLTHTLANQGDSIDTTGGPNPPFQFVAGDDNPVAPPPGTNLLVSDSLVNVPIYNSTPGAVPTSPVQVIGFAQLFLNPDGTKTPTGTGQMDTRVINLVGCGTNATGQPVLGNGSSAIAVRLLSP